MAELQAYTKDTRQDISLHVQPRRRQCCLETPASKDLSRELMKSSSRDTGDVESGFDDAGSREIRGRSQCGDRNAEEGS